MDTKIHPIDLLENLKEMVYKAKGKGRSFDHSIGLSFNSEFFCAGNAIVQPFVTFDGPIFLGENVFIGPYTFLRGPLYISDNVSIGPYSEIKRSFIGKDTKITHRNIIPDSVIGARCWLAGGVMVTNLRLDKQPIKLKWNDLEKKADRFGMFMEDDATLGVGVTVMPGTYVRKKSVVFGPSVIKGII